MQYWIYGLDAISREPREPMFLEADSEDAAREHATEIGMSVEEVELVQPRPRPSKPSELRVNERAVGKSSIASFLVIVFRTLAVLCGVLALARLAVTCRLAAELGEAGGALILDSMLHGIVVVASILAVGELLRLGIAIERNTCPSIEPAPQRPTRRGR